MHFSSVATILLGNTFLLASCRTVPEGAPQDFHLANSAIERADEADVSEILPSTIERAEESLEQALALYEKAEEDDLDSAASDAVFREAKDKAAEAKNLANQALELSRQVNAWDENIGTYLSRPKLNAELSALRARVALTERLDSTRQAGRTIDSDMNFKVPVAFFPTGSDQIRGKFTEAVASLAETLNSHSETKVVLTGYADRRGSAEENEELSKKRAERVAGLLQAMGVSRDRITIEGTGELKFTTKASPAEMQLNRRVDAFVSSEGSPAAVGSR